MRPSIIVRGGAWDIPPDQPEAHRLGTLRAVEAGWAVLDTGGSAVDAVKSTSTVLEGDKALNAGRGSFLNSEGQVEVDAEFMSGAALHVGTVAGV